MSVLELVVLRARISERQFCIECNGTNCCSRPISEVECDELASTSRCFFFQIPGVASSQMMEKSLTLFRRDLYFSYADFLGVESRDELLLHLSEMINQLSADSIYSRRVVDGRDS